MLVKTPKFWLKRNVIAILLLPFSLIYFVIFVLNGFLRREKKVVTPIICVGNVIAGGSGKTPVALALGDILAEAGFSFAYLNRGFGGVRKSCRVDENSKACQVGDEALLLAQKSDVFVDENRLNGVRKIEEIGGFEAIIFDDGMQTKFVKKDLVVMVIDAKIKFGNGFLIPAGPLRQSVKSGLEIADLVVVVGKMDDELREILAVKIAAGDVVEAKINGVNLEGFRGEKLLGFCGLAYPEKFFSYLRNEGFDLVEKQVFSDHYFYKKSDLEKLILKAKKKNLKLVCTKKDWVKFDEEFKQKIGFIDVELEFENRQKVIDKINKHCFRRINR